MAIVRKTKPSDPYDYDYDAVTTTITSTIFDSHQVLTLLAYYYDYDASVNLL